MIQKIKQTTYNTKVLCDVCGQEFASPLQIFSFEQKENANSGAPIDHCRHFHLPCLYQFWKEHQA